MPDELWWLASPLVVAVVAGLWNWITKRTAEPGVREGKIIDQLQEEVAGYRDEVKSLRSEVESLRTEMHRLLGRDAHWSIHVTRQNGVIAGLGGTPLALPAELAS